MADWGGGMPTCCTEDLRDNGWPYNTATDAVSSAHGKQYIANHSTNNKQFPYC